MPRGGKRAGAGRKANNSTERRGQIPNGNQTASLVGSSMEQKEIKEEVNAKLHSDPSLLSRDFTNREGVQPAICEKLHGSDSSISKGASEHQMGNIEIKDSNQNEPKEDSKLNAIPEGVNRSSVISSNQCRENAGSTKIGEGDLHRNGSSQRIESPQAPSRAPLYGDNGEQLHVQRERIQASGSGDLLDQQVYSESKATGGQRIDGSDHRLDATNDSSSNASIIGIDEQIKRLRDPIYFARACCVSKLDEWQSKFLGDARTPGRSALRGANGIGKTVIICILTLFFLSTIKNCRVVIVSGVFRQLKMMVDHLQSLLKNFPGWRVLRGTHELVTPFPNNKAIWFSTDSPGAAQGQHSVVEGINYDEDESACVDLDYNFEKEINESKQEGSCLILIRDECRDIPKGVKDSTDTFGATWTFDLSCPGNAVEWFHDIFSRLTDIYRIHVVTAYQSSHVKPSYIEEMKRIHGEDSARFKNSILAEFTDFDVHNLITVDQIHRCFNNPQPWRNPGFRVAGIDLSAAKKGGDKMICVMRQGNKLFEPYELPNCKSEMEAVGLVVAWARKNQIKYIYADNGGLGSPMISRLAEVLGDDQSCILHRVDFGGDPISTQAHCVNRATELWSVGAGLIEVRDLVFDWTQPFKNDFVSQTTNRNVETMSNGNLILEPKKKMRSRGLKSPDLADATFLALIEPAYERKSVTGLGKTNWADFKEDGTRGKNSFGYGSSGKRFGRG